MTQALLARGLRALAALLVVYAVSCAFLWSQQQRLIFEPDRVMHATPLDFAFPVVEAAVPVHARETLWGWWLPAAPGAPVSLYLHGNDGNVSTSMAEVEHLRELGCALFVVDYRGYGKSSGPFPSEASVYEDAEAAWRYLTGTLGASPDRVYIYGHSLGAAIAIELATRHPEAAGLVVEAGFTSIYDMARLERRYALFPVRAFLHERFDSLSKVPALRLPVLYIHGTADRTVPFWMGERLYAASGGEKRLVAVPGGGHEDNAHAGGASLREALRQFIAARQRS
jgi:pimeloyl-ACP methyl ester carboxylesterase